MSAPAPPAVPGYRIVRELGRGGVATVYLAVQESLGREVALKLLAPELAHDPVAAERFMREARTAARLEHRHIVGVHEVGSHEGQPYLSMELMPGDTVAGGAMPPAQALSVVREIALALDHAHRQGVVHRDVKPENILRRADGSFALSDFGIARTLAPGLELTQEGMTVGTPHYMSPEQVQGRELDGRSDLYSLGVVLHQLLTGELPYRGTDGWNIGMQHIGAPLPRLPAGLQRFQPLLDVLMAKDAGDRPATGADVAQRIDSLLSGDAAATPAAPARRPALLLAATLALVALVLAYVAWRPGVQDEPRKAVAAASAMPSPARRSIAVLPLVNLSGNPENEYFSDGLAETMLDMLAHVPDLTVIARTSSFAFKGKSEDVRKIGQALGATHLLEGSVQQSGQRLRITVQLVRTSDGTRVWSQRYDRAMADVFKVQDEVAAEVVKALELALPGSPGRSMRAGGTESVAAFEEYLRGIALLPLRRISDLETAVVHFEKAISIDPRYAMAYATCANTMTLLQARGALSDEGKRRREQYIQLALKLDPGLGEAYIGRAALLRNEPAAAERDFKRGLELAPGYVTGYQWYAGWLSGHAGRPADAVPILQRAIVIEPLDPPLRVSLGYTLLALGRIEEARSIADTLARNHAEFPDGYGLRSMVHRARGDFPGELRAIDELIAADPKSLVNRLERCHALLRAGLFADARACSRKLETGAAEQEMVAQTEVIAALLQGDAKSFTDLMARRGISDPGLRAIDARFTGKPGEAVAILREAWPKWFANPIDSPNLDNEHQFIEAAEALIAAGDDAQARRVLEFGLAAMSKRRPGPGAGGGRAWSETIALALLGRRREACAAIGEATAAGMYEMREELAHEPLLADLRKEACFAPAYAGADALAKSQVAAARRAGLL